MDQFVSFSGGKDSTALALLSPDAIPIFCDTGWEFPEIYAHIEKFERVTGRQVFRVANAKHKTIPDRIRDYVFFPNHGARWCTREFKIDPINRFLRSRLPCELLIGLRADEPDRIGNLTDLEGLRIRYPLRERGIDYAGVIEICVKHDLLPRYPVYMARGGCIGCFYKRKSEVQAMAALVPDLLDQLQTLEEEVQDERGSFFHMFPNVGMSISDLRRQPMLFDSAQVYVAAAQNGDKGAACGLFCHR